MKRKSILIIIAASLTLSSCLVSSLHPFYHQKDKIFDEALIGKWIDTDSVYWVIEANMKQNKSIDQEVRDSTFHIKYIDKEGTAILKGTLFELNGQRYVDFYPDPDEEHCISEMASYHHIPVHTLARIQFNKDTMMLFWFGEEWLDDLFENKRIRIDHEVLENANSGLHSRVLTADTDDLQKFILKYMNDKKTTAEIEAAFEDDEDTDDHVFIKLFPYEGSIPETE